MSRLRFDSYGQSNIQMNIYSKLIVLYSSTFSQAGHLSRHRGAALERKPASGMSVPGLFAVAPSLSAHMRTHKCFEDKLQLGRVVMIYREGFNSVFT